MAAESESTVQRETLFGHPVGLFTLFFSEMWERFSYYGMRALLVFYMTKGFLGYSDKFAYGVYGAYTALVYAVGFIGGMFADRLLGQRRSAVLGGLLMAGGHLMMTWQYTPAFYLALGLLITGNGFFKPNVSTIVGKLYPAGSPRRDGGFTIYYMGVNLGATLAPLVCGYVGERVGWHYGFGLATIGMLVGLAVFVAPIWLTQILILGTALITAISMLFLQNSVYVLAVNAFAGLALTVAAVAAFVALGRGGLPANAGSPPDPEFLTRKIGPFRTDVLIYIMVILFVPIFALLSRQTEVATWLLLGFGGLALGYVLVEAFRGTQVERERLMVVLILTVFSLLFWGFFEQAGSSMALFIDRNVDRVFETRAIGKPEIGSEITFHVKEETNDPELIQLPLLTQEQLGYENGDPSMADEIATAMLLLNDAKPAEMKLSTENLVALIKNVTSRRSLTSTGLANLREAAKLANSPIRTLKWKIVENDVGMGIGGSEIPASMFQAANPVFILLFGLAFTALWAFLSARGLEPSTPLKFSMALAQLALGFVALWYGAQYAADDRGMVSMAWLLVGILLHTTGELSQSPIGLSMVTKLSPKHLVSTVMGAWFVGLGLANSLAGWIATFTGVGDESGGPQVIPLPKDTVHIYGHVFGQIAVAAFITAAVCLALSPLLTKWMHNDVEQQ